MQKWVLLCLLTVIDTDNKAVMMKQTFLCLYHSAVYLLGNIWNFLFTALVHVFQVVADFLKITGPVCLSKEVYEAINLLK